MADEVEQAPPPLPLPPKAPPVKRPPHHRGAHYMVLTINLVLAVACLIGAAALVFGQSVVASQHKTAALPPPSVAVVATTSTDEPGTTDPVSTNSSAPAAVVATAEATTTTEAFPSADPQAKNFLITGSDNGACTDQDTTNPVEERGQLGERSDTIMIMRVDPSTSRAAVLSFPRDLWVDIAGTNKRGRINSAYRINDPSRLRQTIADAFYIPVDHYIQIDFCAFKTLVDSVGGVAVPFEYPAKDRYTNLDVPTTGCYSFDGDSALAYVRSRHYTYLDPDTNTYKQDPSSDYGRIARQQDFLRRAVAKVVSQGVFDIGVARGLIEVATEYVVTDPDLTPGKQLEFAGVLKNLDPNAIHTYTIEGVGKKINGQDVIEPRLDGENMTAILRIFRNQAQLESAPEQVFAPTVSSTEPGATISTDPAGGTETTTTTTATATSLPADTATTLPAVVVDQKTRGIVPPADQRC